MYLEKKQPWYVYMIRCKNGSLYTGITTDLERRFSEHQNQGNKCAKYLKGKGPLELVYFENVENRQNALKKEAHIKNQSKENKEIMIEQNYNCNRGEFNFPADSPHFARVQGKIKYIGQQ